MLDSLIGRGPFPITSALALKDMENEVWGEPKWAKGYKSLKRFGLSLALLNIVPLVYFARIFQLIDGFIGHTINTIAQILSIGLLSLGVFAFYYFFLGLSMLKSKRTPLFYTPYEFNKLIMKRETIYPRAWTHILAGILYLTLPWLMILFFEVIGLLPS